MKGRLSKRMDSISESVTLKLNGMVQTLISQGQNVVNLTAGEPDFFPPDAASEAVIRSVQNKESKYTPVPGIMELRQLVADKTNRQQPSVKDPWKPNNVIVSHGAKQALFNTILAVVDPGDEVVIPAPYWLSYPEMVQLAGGVPVFVEGPFEAQFKITPEKLRKALSAKTKAVIFNSPSNPTGAMYSPSEFAALGKELEKSDAWIISDEIYDRISYGKIPFCSFLETAPQLQDRVVTINGMSKSAAMTGWRIGWSVATASLTQAINNLQGQCTSGVSALAQRASIAALKLPENDFRGQVDQYLKRRNLAVELLRKCEKIKVSVPEGAFYLFLGVKALLSRGEDSVGFCERILRDQNVALVPGTPFGAPEWVRLSFATSEAELRKGCERILKFV